MSGFLPPQQDCRRFRRQCDQMKVGWFNQATCGRLMSPADILLPVGVILDGRKKDCAQCYQQALSLERQCQEQGYEDARFDFQNVVLTTEFKEIGKWIGIAIVVIVALYAFLRA